ncbi:MAG: hypothetical protein AAB733_03650, partial [Patescibacteria group bacterium]
MKKLLIILFSLVVLGVAVLAGFFILLYLPNGGARGMVTFRIVEGSGVNAISGNLYNAGLLRSK